MNNDASNKLPPAIPNALNFYGKPVASAINQVASVVGNFFTDPTKRVISPNSQSSVNPIGTNPLHSYRSYNYLFTLASLKNEALESVQSFQEGVNGKDYFVVLKSGGKGTAGFDILNVDGFDESRLNYLAEGGGRIRGGDNSKITENQNRREQIKNNKSIIEGFNKESAGRFDFTIDNVVIDVIPSGSEKTNMSLATSIEFEVREQYSMTGFIEAIHVASIAAGHDSYMNSPFLLKLEFLGYTNDNSGKPVSVENSTREFIIRFVEINVDVSDEGAVYKCKAIPQNEQGLGQPSELMSDISMSGVQVREILENFMENLNKTKKQEAVEVYKEEQTEKYDSYSIVFPNVNKDGLDEGYLNKKDYNANKIGTNSLVSVLNSNSIFKFPGPETVGEQEERLIRYDPDNPSIMFAKGSNVLDCIASVIRDSNYVKNILKNPVIDDLGLIEYFFVHIEATKKGIFDEKTNRDFYNYRYVVIPYKIHYTRIQPRLSNPVNTKLIKDIIHRQYDYFYTGHNVDVLKFDLKFNTLFFQAVPKLLGNQFGRPSSAGTQPETLNQTVIPSSNSFNTFRAIATGNSPFGNAPIMVGSDVQGSVVSGMDNANATSSDPYDYMVKGLHQAILENVDQCTAEIEILGDPYYLVTMGIGNIKHKIQSDGTLGLKEAPCYFGDVHVLIQFRNPKDINRKTGLMDFDSRVALYSGLFRVIGIKNSFNGGVFTQKLDLVRVPMQPEDLGYETNTSPAIGLDSEENNEFGPVVAELPAPSTIRADENSLLGDITRLPITGAPGNLSSLIPGPPSVAGTINSFATVGSLAGGAGLGLTGAATAVGNLVNQIRSGRNQGLSNVSSAIRLSNSGLSNLSENINNIGGSIDQVSKSLNTVGLSASTPSSLAAGILNFKPSNFNQLSNQAISAVQSLSDKSSGLVSDVLSKVDGLNGKAAALAGQLGIKLDSLSGLSSDLQTKLVGKISEAAASVPAAVDITAAVTQGLILNDIPTKKLSNIPATQPRAVAPQARPNLADISEILRRGGNIQNLPGVSQIPGIQEIIERASVPSGVVTNNPLDSSAIAGKFSSIQNQLQSVVNVANSVESKNQAVQTVTKTALPNVAPAPSSVINVFGSTEKTLSPLKIALNSTARV